MSEENIPKDFDFSVCKNSTNEQYLKLMINGKYIKIRNNDRFTCTIIDDSQINDTLITSSMNLLDVIDFYKKEMKEKSLKLYEEWKDVE